MREMIVAAAQLGPFADSKQAMISRMVNLVEQASQEGVDALTFPELALSPYFPRALVEDYDKWFETTMPSELTQPLCTAAREARIAFVLPFGELEGETYYNSALVVNSNGSVAGKYRKTHIPGSSDPRVDRFSLEKRYFAPGNLGYPVYDVGEARVGVLICYDRRFPEAFRSYQLAGADIVFLGFNTGAKEVPLQTLTRRSELVMCANAYQHDLWVVAAGKAGIEDGVPQIGGSCIISPEGEIVAKARTVGDELVVATIDLDARVETNLRFMENRRPELYGRLTEPNQELVTSLNRVRRHGRGSDAG